MSTTVAGAGTGAADVAGAGGTGPGAPGAEQLAGLVLAAGPHATAVTLAVARGGRSAVHCHGRTARDGGPCTPDTGYELGSVTKTFTALLLAELAARGEVAPDDPVQRHLPAGRRPPDVRRGGPIRLIHLATHTSGLPGLPPGLLASAVPAWNRTPYASYDEQRFWAALARTTVRRPPGEVYWYSNYGVGLLGWLLAEAGGGPDYAGLLDERVGRPLGLATLSCSPDAPHLATGHHLGRPLPPWRIPALPGAGAVRAGGADLLRFLRAHLEPPDGGPLGTALREVRRPRLRLPRSGPEICLVWNHRRTPDDRDLFFHSGGTRGFTAFVGFCPQTATAVAALTNSGPTVRSTFIQTAYDTFKRLARPDGETAGSG
ncbi:serine hydrolase domain-containing protein [Kitasatospora purpeofusca]|uniref:serine hydrolase domain-containing protein n=1 Tax=Kitasatospora purpeofusca TaxID=67352 RepID=UPI002252ABBF|nr:serine hydrolase domain-containing protein [Kitasatospora purpeofusca]MCX4756772.1 beta-lactamase family protein [Kitasatospora purpeofusca]WSR35444.1 beta-lactamase family protein [Kitasatospora purpeofusca]